MDLPQELIKNLKCVCCDNFLSYFPIFHSFNFDNVCGRCSSYETITNKRNMAYETLAHQTRFPCRFESDGCSQELVPEKIPDHEEECYYRKVCCATKSWTECAWEGSYPKAKHHCMDVHAEFLLEDDGKFSQDPNEKNESYSLIKHDDTMLVFWKRFEPASARLEFAVYFTSYEVDTSIYPCQLSILNGTENSVSFDFNSSNATSTTDITSFETKIVKNEGLHASGTIVIKKNEKVIWELLNILKCLNCQKFVAPPVFLCLDKSDPICEICVEEEHCSNISCRNIEQHRKDVTLDKMANLLNYPCKNFNNGCKIILKPENIINHQYFCEFGEYKCLLSRVSSCQWTGRFADLASHLTGDHSDILVQNGFRLQLRTMPLSGARIIQFGNCHFVIYYRHNRDDDHVYFYINLVEFSRTQFMYHIEATEFENRSDAVILKGDCHRRLEPEDLTEEEVFDGTFDVVHLEKFLSVEKIRFAIRIVKK